MKIDIDLYCPACHDILESLFIRKGEFYVLPCKNNCGRKEYDEQRNRKPNLGREEDYEARRFRGDLPYITR